MRDDELAKTATAVETSPTSVGRIARTQLGRYRIDGELGAGGMGIVYAAFDPELERRVALKVLRPGLEGDGEQRLLREARAMARLSHPNVVSVFEVGTVDDCDYIAMELVDGGSLLEWLATKPPQRAVLDAFTAAGTGLATAHEAGVVHRDFKPHNVLRSKTGRIVVTDFGLAREATNVAPIASRDTPSSLSGLTVPGSLLGTPAYMAPEQWEGRDISAATDQFAFCVALWEALAGERPFRGDTIEAIQEAILRGPDSLDSSVLPRRLRAPIVRGLALDPAKRWPTMPALLARLAPRKTLAIGLGAGVVAAVAIAFALHRAPAASSCEPPAVSPDAVWSVPQQLLTRAGSPEAAAKIDTAIAQWKQLRGEVCARPGAAPKLACLDRVLARIDAVRRARLYDPQMSLWGVSSQMYAPDVCMRDDPPRLPVSYSEAAVIGLALRSAAQIQPATIARARSTLERDACARSYFDFLDPSVAGANDAKSAAELCGDDQAYGAATMNSLSRETGFLDPDLAQKMHEAERAIDRAANPFLTRQFYGFQADQAQSAGDIDRALALYERAIGDEPDLADARYRVFRMGVLLARAAPEDLALVAREATALETREIDSFSRAQIAAIAATVKWLRGEDGAYATLAKIDTVVRAAVPPPAKLDAIAVHGVVVDAQGQPIANAEVATGEDLFGDASGVALALYDPRAFPVDAQRTVTDAKGQFAFERVSPRGVVVAGRGTDRSKPAAPRAELRLVLAPMTTLHGHVAIASDRGVLLVAAAIDPAYTLVAPMRADGSYELAAPPGARVRAKRIELAATRDGPLGTVNLESPPARELEVIARSATGMSIDAMQVTVVAGAVHPATVGELRRVVMTVPAATGVAQSVVGKTAGELHRGDLIAHVRGAALGAITACTQAIHIDPNDPDFASHYALHEYEQPIQCTVLDASAARVVIEVPAMKRID